MSDNLKASSEWVSRRKVLGMATAGIALAVAFPMQAKAAKATQAQAGYQNSPKGGQHCELCRYFQKPSSCQLVAGTISPNGWCKFFNAKG